MKIIAPNRNIKYKVRLIAEFKNLVKAAKYKSEAIVVLCDKKHNIFNGSMRIGSYCDAYELTRKSGIELISYQAVHAEPPKKTHLITKDEYIKLTKED